MTENWDVRRSGPVEAEHRALLLPGGMCTTEFYADLMAEPALAEAGLGLVALTLPGFGRTTPPEDLSMENYARLTADFAAAEGCDVAVGHSLGANVALEMAALGLFPGPLVLLSPTFSRADEASFLTVMDAIGQIPKLGPLAWSALMKATPKMMKRELPPARAEDLAADLANNDPVFCREVVHHYYRYLDRYPSLVPRLRGSGARAWVVRGDHDEIGLKDAERTDLTASPRVTTVTVPDAGHLLLVEQPARVAEIVLEATRAAPDRYRD